MREVKRFHVLLIWSALWYNEGMTSPDNQTDTKQTTPEALAPIEDNAPKEIPKKPDPKETEKEIRERIASQVEIPKEIMGEEDDGLLVEEEGDVFWILQGVVWGILKTVIFVGILGFLVWIIWGSNVSINLFSRDDTDAPPTIERPPRVPREKEPEERPPEKEEPKLGDAPIIDEVPAITGGDGQAILQAVQLGYQLEASRLAGEGGSVSRTINWLSQSRVVGDTFVAEYMATRNPERRAQQLEIVFEEVDDLLAEAAVLRATLTQEIETYTAGSQAAQENAQVLQNALYASIQKFHGAQAEELLPEVIEAQQEYAAEQEELMLRQSLLKNLNNFERLLRLRVVPIALPDAQLLQGE